MDRFNDMDPMLHDILLGYPQARPRNTERPKRMSNGFRNASCGTSDPWLVVFPVDRMTLLTNLCQHLPPCRYHRSGGHVSGPARAARDVGHLGRPASTAADAMSSRP